MVVIIKERIEDMVKRGMTRGAGEGREADARLRSALRSRDRAVDDGDVHRSRVPGRLEGGDAEAGRGRAKSAPAAKGKK